MPSNSEVSFGARLRKAQDGVEYIKKWGGYQPPRPQETVPEITILINTIQQNNNDETAMQIAYAAAVETRQNLFTKKDGSIEKLLVPLRGAAEAQFGRNSPVVKQVAAIIATIRKSKLIKLPTDPSKPDVQTTVSQSQRSYGSRTQFFSDIVTTFAQTPGYTSSNPQLTVAGLQAKVAEINAASNTVAAALQDIRNIRSIRTKNYEELADRIKRIKAYTKSQYGTQSPEYRSLVELGF